MPELHFRVQWPDGRLVRYYSPSSTLHQHLRANESYALTEFLARSRAAMAEASERVRQKYGFACSSARATLQQIEDAATAFADQPEAVVKVVE